MVLEKPNLLIKCEDTAPCGKHKKFHAPCDRNGENMCLYRDFSYEPVSIIKKNCIQNKIHIFIFSYLKRQRCLSQSETWMTILLYQWYLSYLVVLDAFIFYLYCLCRPCKTTKCMCAKDCVPLVN